MPYVVVRRRLASGFEGRELCVRSGSEHRNVVGPMRLGSLGLAGSHTVNPRGP